MNIREFLDDIEKRPVNEENVKAIESRYGFTIPDIVKHIVSEDEAFFSDDEDEEIRVLPFDEILDAEDDLECDFKGRESSRWRIVTTTTS